MPLEMADLAKRLPTMEFSKIANVAGLDDEEGLEFMRGLYRAAVVAKDDGDWSRVETFLDEWETKLISRPRPNALRYEDSPWHPFTKPLKDARVALIGTGPAFFVTAAGFAVSTLLIATLRLRPAEATAPGGDRGLLSGLRYVFAHRLFLAVIGLSFFSSVFGMS